jgi:hypothetical protein
MDLEKNSHGRLSDTKANSLLCPVCCVEYVQVEFDLEVDGVVLRNVRALMCPSCKEEIFAPEHYEEIIKRLNDPA